jgi:hypothetical protein
VSTASITVTSDTPKSTQSNPSGRQGKPLLTCGYDLPASASALTAQIVLISADYGGDAGAVYNGYAKLADCASPNRPSSCTESIDTGLSSYGKLSNETYGIEVGQPLGENASSFGATPATRLAGIAVTVRDGSVVCSTAALTDLSSEDGSELATLGDHVRRAVESMCGQP